MLDTLIDLWPAALAGLGAGALLSNRKVGILVPAILVGAALSGGIGLATDSSALTTGLAIVTVTVTLQVGYIVALGLRFALKAKRG